MTIIKTINFLYPIFGVLLFVQIQATPIDPPLTNNFELYLVDSFNKDNDVLNSIHFPKKNEQIPNFYASKEGIKLRKLMDFSDEHFRQYNEDMRIRNERIEQMNRLQEMNDNAIKKFNEDLAVERQEIEERRQEISKRRYIKVVIGFVGLGVVACIYYCFRFCICKKTTNGVTYQESVVIGAEEEQQPTHHTDKIIPPPPYQEAILAPSVPNSEESLTKHK